MRTRVESAEQLALQRSRDCSGYIAQVRSEQAKGLVLQRQVREARAQCESWRRRLLVAERGLEHRDRAKVLLLDALEDQRARADFAEAGWQGCARERDGEAVRRVGAEEGLLEEEAQADRLRQQVELLDLELSVKENLVQQARKTTRLYEEVLMQCAPDLARKLLEVRQQGELQSTSLRQAAEEAL